MTPATRKLRRSSSFRFAPLTPERWEDVERLFGERGACGGCWCMAWRLKRSAWEAQKGAGNRRAFKRIVERGAEPGILAYAGDEPVGWCALAPREEYTVLARSRVLAPVDGEPVWSVTCFFIAKDWRRKGLSTKLLEAAAKHARRHGAKLLEGYPVVPSMDPMPAAFAWTGLPSAFKRAGFREVARRSKSRPIVRREL